MSVISRKLTKVRKFPLWKQQLCLIREVRERSRAPVDIEGCHAVADARVPKGLSDFYVLVASLLSSQTKDAVVFAAMERLKSQGLTVDNVLKTEAGVLAALIKPVGFYNRKASYLKRICAVLRDSGRDEIPQTVKGLTQLPGIGPKMAYLILNTVTDKAHGICVDTHVHRISNRLGWVKTKTPEQTRKALESWLPKKYWVSTNKLIVGFGQTVCKSRNPQCHTCPLRDICPSW